MIIVKLQGGVGNQLFQWALSKSLSLKHNIDSFLDINGYKNQIGITERNFLLSNFPNIVFNVFGGFYGNDGLIVRDNFYFKEFNIEKNKKYFFDGYWQSEKYFLNYEKEIKNNLSPSQETLNKLLSLNVLNNNSVSLHIRRTDYVKSNGLHPVQSVDYYKKALDIIGHYDNILVFSDDIEWCKNNIKFENINFIEGISDIENIFLMSMCKNNIIANSSFSWWGAWLNNNGNKQVIAPKNWFGPQLGLNTSDIVPETWIKI